MTTAPISAFDFRHSIASSTEAFYRVFRHSMDAADMLFGFLLPAIVGNIIGGFLLVALLNHGQVRRAQLEEALLARRRLTFPRRV